MLMIRAEAVEGLLKESDGAPLGCCRVDFELSRERILAAAKKRGISLGSRNNKVFNMSHLSGTRNVQRVMAVVETFVYDFYAAVGGDVLAFSIDTRFAKPPFLLFFSADFFSDFGPASTIDMPGSVRAAMQKPWAFTSRLGSQGGDDFADRFLSQIMPGAWHAPVAATLQAFELDRPPEALKHLSESPSLEEILESWQMPSGNDEVRAS